MNKPVAAMITLALVLIVTVPLVRPVSHQTVSAYAPQDPSPPVSEPPSHNGETPRDGLPTPVSYESLRPAVNATAMPPIREYHNAEWGYSISYPAGWQEEIAFENGPDRPFGIIRQRLNIEGPKGALVSLEVWQNPHGVGLMDWIDQHQRRVLELGGVTIPASPNAVISRRNAVVVSQPETCSSPAIASAYASTHDRVFRIQYTAFDGGDALDTFREMLASLELRPFPETSQQPDADHSVSFELPPELLRISEALEEDCDYSENAEGCCGYPQIWWWQCSEDASGEHKGNCTYWAAYRRQDLLGHFTGHAGQWADNAKSAGFPVNGSPIVGDIMVDESIGHVAYVTAVSDNGVDVTEMNWCTKCPENPAHYGVSGMRFIHCMSFWHGDGNCDGCVDDLDFVSWWKSYRKDLGADYNGDGITDELDYATWWIYYGEGC